MMCARIFRSILFLFCAVHLAGAEELDELNAYYSAGDYQRAADEYEKILDAKGHNADVYYNLGNAYQRLKRYGHAILAYERALLIDPRDPDIRANLEQARKEISDFSESGQTSPSASFRKFFSRNELSWIAVCAAFAACGTVFFAGCKRLKNRWPRRVAFGVVATSLLVLVVAGTVLYLRSDEGTRAVIISDDGVIRLSPFSDAEVVATPKPGRVVGLGGKVAGFRYVTIPDQGLSGWMAEVDVERIEK